MSTMGTRWRGVSFAISMLLPLLLLHTAGAQQQQQQQQQPGRRRNSSWMDFFLIAEGSAVDQAGEVALLLAALCVTYMFAKAVVRLVMRPLWWFLRPSTPSYSKVRTADHFEDDNDETLLEDNDLCDHDEERATGQEIEMTSDHETIVTAG